MGFGWVLRNATVGEGPKASLTTHQRIKRVLQNSHLQSQILISESESVIPAILVFPSASTNEPALTCSS